MLDKKLWNEDDDNTDRDDACSFGWNRRRKEVYLKENPSSHASFFGADEEGKCDGNGSDDDDEADVTDH